jgi:hypothetical protein
VIAVVHFLVAYFFSFPCIEIEDRKLATYWSQEHRKGIGLTTMLRGSSCLSSGASKSSRARESIVEVVTFQGAEASSVAKSKEVAAAWCVCGGGGGAQPTTTYRHGTPQRGRPQAPGRAPPRRDLVPRGAAAQGREAGSPRRSQSRPRGSSFRCVPAEPWRRR